MKPNKKLVAYFSCTGTTKKAAEKLAQYINADLYEIVPKNPYTSADLNWQDKNSRSSIEMRDTNFRPEIAGKFSEISHYETVFIGFPVWWYIAPTIINTFIESCNLDGKTVIPFATSGGSGIENCENNLRKEYKQIEWRSGKLLNGEININTLQKWLEKTNI